MPNTTKLRRVGNSTGTTFKSEDLRAAGFAENDLLEVHASPGQLLLTPHDGRKFVMLEAGLVQEIQGKPSKLSIEKLVASVTQQLKDQEG